MHVTHVLAVLLVVLLVASTSFAASPSQGESLSPVDFGETLKMGMTGVDVREARAAGYEIPKAEVFYAQYRYAVGFYGIASLVDELGQEGRPGQFGEPLAVFVTDYARAEPGLTDEGYLVVGSAPGVGWVAASDAHYVVGSRARTPGGPAVVPFSSASAAASFADAHGGEVVGWAGLRRAVGGGPDLTRESLRVQVENRSAWADATVAATRDLTERPVSVVVGEDAPTLRAAVDRAPANTTVRVPPGTYETNLTISKPLTLAGAGNATVLRGDGNGTVLRAFAPRVAIRSLRIDGVGDNVSVANLPEGGDWDQRVQLVYGYGDSAIAFDGADGSLVANVEISTPANGVVVRSSDGVVVRDSTVRGEIPWQEGFMGVVAMHSRIVVQNDTFLGGRDAVYTHRAHGLVVRDSYMDTMRFGVHEMYTSGALVANNTVRRTDIGVVVMTRPASNAVVDNDVRDSDIGVSVAGSASYVAGNVLANDTYGMYVSAKRSLYERNVLASNRYGARADTVLPTNRVVDNDFVDNDRFVRTRSGPLRIWTHRGRGNYWGPIPAFDRDGDGVYDRSFHPSDAVDGLAQRVDGIATLARSPASTVRRQLQDAVPGLRSVGVVDTAPRTRPVRPDVVDRLDAGGGAG